MLRVCGRESVTEGGAPLSVVDDDVSMLAMGKRLTGRYLQNCALQYSQFRVSMYAPSCDEEPVCQYFKH